MESCWSCVPLKSFVAAKLLSLSCLNTTLPYGYLFKLWSLSKYWLLVVEGAHTQLMCIHEQLWSSPSGSITHLARVSGSLIFMRLTTTRGPAFSRLLSLHTYGCGAHVLKDFLSNIEHHLRFPLNLYIKYSYSVKYDLVKTWLSIVTKTLPRHGCSHWREELVHLL